CIHIGKKTWEKDGINSYNLNDTGQFVLKNDSVTVNVYSSNKDILSWKRFKDNANGMLDSYTRYTDKKITSLSEVDKVIFKNNEFNYIRQIMAPISQYLDLLRENRNKWVCFLNEGVV